MMAVDKNYAKQAYAESPYASQGYLDGTYWDGGFADSEYWDPTKVYKPKSVSSGLASPASSAQSNDDVDSPGGNAGDDPGVWEDQYTRGIEDPSFANSYGWTDVPENMRAAFNVPGAAPLGMAIKAGASLVNAASIDKTRKDLGLDPKGVLGGAFNANLGVIGTVEIGDQTYTVSANPNPKDPNMISPVEAQAIAAQTGHTIKEASKENVKAREAQMKQLGTTPSTITNRGALGSVAKQAATSVMNELTGKKPAAKEEPVAKATPTSVSAPTTSIERSGLAAPSVSAPEPSRSITPGLGLANLVSTPERASPSISNKVGFDPAFSAKIDETGLQGKGRYATPDEQALGMIANAVGVTLGPDYTVGLTSGTYSREHAAQIEEARSKAQAEAAQRGLGREASKAHVDQAVKDAGGVGSPRHSTALAADFHVKDPAGNLVTGQQLQDVIGSLASSGMSVGFGQGYMGNATIHADDVRPANPNSWGGGVNTASLKESQMAAAQQRTALDAYSGIATPTPRDEALGLATQPEIAQSTPSQPGAMSPSSFSSMGLGYQYSPEEKNAMSVTLAGELSPSTLQGIARGDPTAVAEAAAVLGTMDNRAMTSRAIDKENKYGPMESVLSPSQYNALDSRPNAKGVSNLDTSINNYQGFKTELDTVVNDYFDKGLASPAPDATHYANLDIADPAWGQALDTKVGDHTFGKPDQSWSNVQDAYGTAFGPASGVGIGPETLGQSFVDPSENVMGNVDVAGAGFVDPDSMSSVDKAAEAAAETEAGSKGGTTDDTPDNDASDSSGGNGSGGSMFDKDDESEAGGGFSSSLF